MYLIVGPANAVQRAMPAHQRPALGYQQSSAPPAPTGVTVITDARRLRVNWQPIYATEATLTGFIVRLFESPQGGDPLQTCTTQGWVFTCEFSNLKTGRAYFVEVASQKGALETLAGPRVMSATGGPQPPLRSQATIGASGVTVTWEPPTTSPSAPILSYEAQAVPILGAGEASGSVATLTCQTESISCVIVGLDPRRFYSIRLIANNRFGSSSPVIIGNTRIASDQGRTIAALTPAKQKGGKKTQKRR